MTICLLNEVSTTLAIAQRGEKIIIQVLFNGSCFKIVYSHQTMRTTLVMQMKVGDTKHPHQPPPINDVAVQSVAH